MEELEEVEEVEEEEEEEEEKEKEEEEEKEEKEEFVFFFFLVSLNHSNNLSISSMVGASNLPNQRRHSFASSSHETSRASRVKARRIPIPFLIKKVPCLQPPFVSRHSF